MTTPTTPSTNWSIELDDAMYAISGLRMVDLKYAAQRHKQMADKFKKAVWAIKIQCLLSRQTQRSRRAIRKMKRKYYS